MYPPLLCDGQDPCRAINALAQLVGAVSMQIAALRTDVTLIQRHRVPMGYMPGPVTSSVSGQGSIAVSRALGVLVLVEHTPTSQRALPGDPPYMWDLGWMAINDDNGMIREQRITRMAQIWLPDDCELATYITYYLDAGVVATFVPLNPEA